MRTTASFVLVLVACLAGCAKQAGPTTAPTGGVAATGPAAAAFSETMADAPTHTLPATLELKPPCNANGYLKLAVPAGTSFTLDATVSAGSVMLGVLDANGGSVGDTLEVTSDAPKGLPGSGQPGTTFVTVSETGACTGNTVTLSIK